MYLHYLLSRRRHFTIWTVFKKGKKFSLKKVKIQTPISNPSGALKGSFSKVQNVKGYIGNNDAPFWLVSWPKLKVYIYIYEWFIYYSIKKQIYILRYDISWSCSNHQWNSVYFRSTFIASIYKYMINNKCNKGKEGLLWFQDPTLLICGFHHPRSGISSSTEVSPISLEHRGSRTGHRS